MELNQGWLKTARSLFSRFLIFQSCCVGAD